MNFKEYQAYFESIIAKKASEQEVPYDNPDYLDYTRLNWSRMNRWFKTAKISDDLAGVLQKINTPQHWIVITEPWCGDAAHNIPLIEMMAEQNPLTSISYELRDSAPFLINEYLTNGTKSIPKLIIRDEDGKDLGTWGPRPEDCQKMYAGLMEEGADFERVKVEIQNWYNANKGVDIQNELGILLSKIIA